MNEDHFFRALEEGRIRKARAILEKANEETPRARRLYLEGLMLENMGELEEALKKFNMALVLHLSDPALWLAKAKVLEELGSMDMAKRSASRACRLSTGDPAANLLYADILYKMKEFDEATKQVDMVLELAPKDSDGLTLKGILISIQEEDYRKALQYFDKAIDNDEDNASAWTNRGIALRQIGDRDGAIFSFQKALMIDPDDRVSRDMLTHLGEKKFIPRSRSRSKKKWSRSKYMTDSQGKMPFRPSGPRKKKKEPMENNDDTASVEWLDDDGEEPSAEDDQGPEEIDEMEVVIEEMEEPGKEDLEVSPEEVSAEDLDEPVLVPEPDIPSPGNGEEDEDDVEQWEDVRETPDIVGDGPKVEHPPSKKRSKKKVKKKRGSKKVFAGKEQEKKRSIGLTCPQCGEKFTVEVKGRTDFSCPGCGLRGEIE
ncbi:MAG: tetratricopeptide repeat protein [Thermoplasmatota archaeon]